MRGGRDQTFRIRCKNELFLSREGFFSPLQFSFLPLPSLPLFISPFPYRQTDRHTQAKDGACATPDFLRYRPEVATTFPSIKSDLLEKKIDIDNNLKIYI